MKNNQYVSTPYGDFSKNSRRAYQFVSIWLRPDTHTYQAVWHQVMQNVEQCKCAGVSQLMGVWRVEPWRREEPKAYSQQVRYVI